MSQENLSLGCPTTYDTNRAVQPKKMARCLKFGIDEVEVLNSLCSKNKGADQLQVTAQLICDFEFANAKSPFSHAETKIYIVELLHNKSNDMVTKLPLSLCSLSVPFL